MRKRVTATTLAAMLKALTEGSHTFAGLMALTGLQQVTVSAWIRELRRAGLVCVALWDLDSRGYPTIARFAWGADDCIKPTMTPAQRMRLSRARAAANA